MKKKIEESVELTEKLTVYSYSIHNITNRIRDTTDCIADNCLKRQPRQLTFNASHMA